MDPNKNLGLGVLECGDCSPGAAALTCEGTPGRVRCTLANLKKHYLKSKYLLYKNHEMGLVFTSCTVHNDSLGLRNSYSSLPLPQKKKLMRENFIIHYIQL